jgi:hypothetical protein
MNDSGISVVRSSKQWKSHLVCFSNVPQIPASKDLPQF